MKNNSFTMFWNSEDINHLPFEGSQIEEMSVLYPTAMRYIISVFNFIIENDLDQSSRTGIQHISSRLKSPSSIEAKLRRNHMPVDYLTMKREILDIAGIRVVCSYVSDVYDLVYKITAMEGITLIKVKDYIEKPKKNGYRSLHLIIAVPVFHFNKRHIIPVEIQFRTIAMDFWASLEHQLCYKSEQEVSSAVTHQLASIAERIHEADLEMQQIYYAISGLNHHAYI